MTLTAEEKATLSNIRMEKAREFLEENNPYFFLQGYSN